jgi:hypothetical protein
VIRRHETPEMAGYAGACHRAALCADPVNSNPPYGLDFVLLGFTLKKRASSLEASLWVQAVTSSPALSAVYTPSTVMTMSFSSVESLRKAISG